jgi:hypothetical protein
MRYYTQLSEDEIRAICLHYPYKDLINGFKKFPKNFSALMPGRRPQSISEEGGRNLIANNPHSNLTIKMVEAFLTSWVPQIAAIVKKQIADGKNTDFAYIVAFSELGFPSFARIYFRFADECFSDERISAIESGAAALSAEKAHTKEQSDFAATSKKIEELRRKTIKELKEKDQEVKRKVSEIKALTKELSEERKKTTALLEEVQQKEKIQAQFAEAAIEIKRLKQEIQACNSRLKLAQDAERDSEERVRVCSKKITALHFELADSQTRLAELEQAKSAVLDLTYSDTVDELRPIDMDEFIDYLSYNLLNIGLDRTQPYFPLLIGYLRDTIFNSKPIICNQAIGHTLARCISNTICGSPDVRTLPYTKEITSTDIQNLLETDNRILVLDSFIGNFNEKELFPILRRVKRKIIIITAEYDKTIAYLLPEEVMINCTYINAGHIPALFGVNALEEEPSIIREELALPIYERPNSRAQRLCKEIMRELSYPSVVIDALSEQMSSEEKLAEFLTFSIIPYSIEAYGISPYNASDRLEKYAGFSGKCAYKELLLEWYGDV